jgi:hypothetical protein
MTDYRYSLVREWSDAGRAVWVMLNPSTADETTDDPTIAKITKFSRAWACGSLEVVNLFACRATDPKALKTISDPVGPENDKHIAEALDRADVVIAAWGASYPKQLALRPHRVRKLLFAQPKPPLVLGLTKDREPRHPLYVRDAEIPFRWTP